MRQKAGEIQAYHVYEKGEEKWRKEHMSRKGQGSISEEGQEILERQGHLDKRDNPSRSNLRIQKTGKKQRRRCIYAASERTNHVHIHGRLVPQGGRGTRAVGRMDEADLGQVTRPKENATDKLSYVPV